MKQSLTPKQIANSGFTLIELLVVISIIGVLTAALLANFVGVRGRATDSQKKGNLNQFKKALRLYYNDYQKYPEGNGSALYGCGDDAVTSCGLSGGSFSANGVDYMKKLPSDDTMEYYNQATTDDEVFVLVTQLENASDQGIAESQARCASSIADENLTLDSNQYVTCED